MKKIIESTESTESTNNDEPITVEHKNWTKDNDFSIPSEPKNESKKIKKGE